MYVGTSGFGTRGLSARGLNARGLNEPQPMAATKPEYKARANLCTAPGVAWDLTHDANSLVKRVWH